MRGNDAKLLPFSSIVGDGLRSAPVVSTCFMCTSWSVADQTRSQTTVK
jgi:hypothetical protein